MIRLFEVLGNLSEDYKQDERFRKLGGSVVDDVVSDVNTNSLNSTLGPLSRFYASFQMVVEKFQKDVRSKEIKLERFRDDYQRFVR